MRSVLTLTKTHKKVKGVAHTHTSTHTSQSKYPTAQVQVLNEQKKNAPREGEGHAPTRAG